MTHGAHKALFIALLVYASNVGGCAPNVGTGLVDGGWPWRPHALNVHELSHVTRPNDRGDRSVAVRIEFLDVAGDATKAHGILDVRVVRVNEGDDPSPVRVDLTTSSATYERVTQTYLLVIEPALPGLVEGRRLRIEASYSTPDGAMLTATRTLTWPATPERTVPGTS
jgi:hypothetical protein